ncbi:DUF4192 domain-containing protein [Nocardioides litoris]|uniref:DUF4192 domain-containing protein n=1 Tax=Nocardioides litoris TaxID=1926648 RepID=UPI0011202BBB|nr:DUF4192 domain-containing protein [Nocardioides litoris]
MTSSLPGAPVRPAMTARSPEDLVAAGVVVLGFWPTESVVMMTLDADHSFHARVDLPPAPTDLPAVAALLVEPAVHHHTTRVVLLVHTSDRVRARAAWRALRTAFRGAGVDVVTALHVGDDRWWSLTGGGPGGVSGDTEGTPLDRDRLAAHPFLAQAVVDGRVVQPSRAALAAGLEPDPVAVARVAALAARLPTRSAEVLASVAVQADEGAWTHALVDRHLADPARPAPSDAEAARLLGGMASLRVRDAAWAAITRDRAPVATAFFTDLLRRAPEHLRAAPATLTAWSAWQAGDGALAWCALERCEAVDPDYGLAALLTDALERAVPPTVWAGGFDWREGLDLT